MIEERLLPFLRNELEWFYEMTLFVDAHQMGVFDEDSLKKLQDSPTDEFGITHKNILYNEDEDKIFCILNAPNKEAVEKHHSHAGLKCDWITEVKSTA